MKIQAIIFDDEKDLQELTGLNHDQLWDAGFDLDDWDFGIAIEESLTTQYAEASGNGALANCWSYYEFPEVIQWMLDSCYCVRHVEYNGNRYMMSYHS